MLTSILLLTCVIGVEPVRVRPLNISRPLPADSPQAILCLPPASALDAVRVESPLEFEPTSALTALGIEVPDLSPVTMEVAEVLRHWEAASRDVKTAQFELRRTVYNLVFDTEQRSDGELCFEGSGKVSMVLRPAIIPKGMKGARFAKNGAPFRLEEGQKESWIWTDHEMATANDEERVYVRIHVAPPSRLSFTPSIFFAGSAEKLREAFDISLVTRRDDRIVLKAVSRTIALKQMFREWVLLMDGNTFQFTAAKCFDPTGKLEVVYKLENGIINQPLPGDCFDPAMKWSEYREFKLD